MMFSPCFFCDGRCCKTYAITVTSYDIVLIAKHIKKHPSEFSCLTKSTLLNSDYATTIECIDKSTNAIISYVLTLKGDPCIFLKNNKCIIHEFSPLVCRLYPYNYCGKVIKSSLCFFPSKILYHLSKPDLQLVNQFQKNLYAYKKLVREWNVKHKYKTQEECFEFLITKSEEIIETL